MIRRVELLLILLVAINFSIVTSDVIIYMITFLPCVPNLSCPLGNPTSFSHTFTLNDTLSPNLTLSVGDQLQFNLVTSVPNHPLTICQNSPPPRYCQGAANADELNTPITQAGATTGVTFTTTGTYYYGCKNHPGMGAKIDVIQHTTRDSSSSVNILTSTTSFISSSTRNTSSVFQLSVVLLFIFMVALFKVTLF